MRMVGVLSPVLGSACIAMWPSPPMLLCVYILVCSSCRSTRMSGRPRRMSIMLLWFPVVLRLKATGWTCPAHGRLSLLRYCDYEFVRVGTRNIWVVGRLVSPVGARLGPLPSVRVMCIICLMWLGAKRRLSCAAASCLRSPVTCLCRLCLVPMQCSVCLTCPLVRLALSLWWWFLRSVGNRGVTIGPMSFTLVCTELSPPSVCRTLLLRLLSVLMGR